MFPGLLLCRFRGRYGGTALWLVPVNRQGSEGRKKGKKKGKRREKDGEERILAVAEVADRGCCRITLIKMESCCTILGCVAKSASVSRMFG